MFGSPGGMPEEVAAGFDYLCATYGKGPINTVRSQHEQALQAMMAGTG